MRPTILKSPLTQALLLFIVASLLTRYLCGCYFGASLDEGIYLNGGRRIADGQRLYLDFFAFIGPLIYWVQAALSSLFGNYLPSLRWSTSLSVGAICVGSFYCARSVAGSSAGLTGTLLWLGVWLDLPNRMEVNHRWLSSGFSALAIAALLGAPASSRIWNMLAGIFMGLAIFTTPNYAVCAGLLGIYFLIAERPRFWPYLLGGCLACLSIAGVLAAQGSLHSFINGILWATANYGEPNKFPYGRFAAEVPTRYFLQIYMGAICIPLFFISVAGFFFWTRDRRLILPTVLCAALFTTAYPKWDAYSLHFISGPFFVLCFALAYRLIPEKLQQLAQGLSFAVFTYLLIGAWTLPDRLTVIPTRAGTLMGSEASERVMAKLEALIPARSSVFVYPYLTGLYALLDVENRSSHDYLQPGMMTAQDEATVLVDLIKAPPQFIFWQNFPDADILRIWPNSNPGKYRFTKLEAWIRGHYQADLEIAESNIRGQVWMLKTP